VPPRRICLLIVVALLLAACGGGPNPAQVAGTAYSAADLARIILQAAEAPSGTEFQAQESGPQTQEQLAENDQENAKLTELGFRSAHAALFVTPALTTAEDPSQIPPGARFVAALAVSMKDATSAQEAFVFFREDVEADAQGEAPLGGGGLGDRAYGIRYSALDQETPFPGFLYLWQRGSGVFGVIVAGVGEAASQSETLVLSRTMDARAKDK
jgi:hypothetical protein